MTTRRISIVAALVLATAVAGCGKKNPPAAPENTSMGSGSAMAPAGTGGNGYGGMGYGGKK